MHPEFTVAIVPALRPSRALAGLVSTQIYATLRTNGRKNTGRGRATSGSANAGTCVAALRNYDLARRRFRRPAAAATNDMVTTNQNSAVPTTQTKWPETPEG